jgi:hypothetical protein
MEEAKGLSYQYPLFPEISEVEGNWLDFPYDFGRFSADLEALCFGYARTCYCRADPEGSRNAVDICA